MFWRLLILLCKPWIRRYLGDEHTCMVYPYRLLFSPWGTRVRRSPPPLVGSLFLKGLRALRAPTPTTSVLGACAKADQSRYRWLTSDHVLVVPSQVNLDLTISVLSFLLSDNALFLRDALINELLDTMDEVRFGCCRVRVAFSPCFSGSKKTPWCAE